MPKTKAKVTTNVEHDSDDMFVTDGDNKPSQAQSRRRKNRLSRLEEYDEDPGRDGSKKYQKLAKMLDTCTTQEAGKTKAFLKEFRKSVTKRETELKTFRQKKEQEFIKGQEKFAAIFKQLSQQLSDGGAGALRKEDHPLFQQARTNMEDHQSLMEQFKLVEEQLNSNKLELPVVRWKKDEQEIKELLACSSRYGEALVGTALAPGSAAVVDRLDASEEDRFAKELFKDCQKTLVDGETWGYVAADQLKHFSAIARMVPPENEVHNEYGRTD
ncbi:hypothetical protein GGS21DRAFT_304622 [Xylaria nigripes]|nr:hypothetical protein GGS21DRAFT_304622 [Xylaria nigripes]